MYSQYSPIPRISISPPPPEDPVFEPFSPFQAISFPSQFEDGFRPAHLTPPPTSTHFKRPFERSDKGPENDTARGLESDRFRALLKATKERNAVADSKKEVNLRKELALKVHKNKQAERRALFLSKVHAPPSPTATETPKTPPESPSVFHFSLPSPGLVSPLALFETLDKDRSEWVEQVDFRTSDTEACKLKPTEKRKSSLALPSLDQISARMIPRNIKPNDYDVDDDIPTPNSLDRRSIGVGRLRMPLRGRPAPLDLRFETQPQIQHSNLESPILQVTTPDMHVTTMLVPKNHTTSPTELTESNLNALNFRGQKAHNMLSTLKRRTASIDALFPVLPRLHGEDTKWRRNSAPPDMACRPRLGFKHPVLIMAGGF
ncbi:hypothetical protein CPB83DRAFT_901499 [Crepidotus variabilis]|uniref:Uncharacterized protein n=1 Tax=Crepidotus variabilis TaxID=179855 RepID=A0A9P6JWL4_9AGAR|nr:hypothetical protein CPB83DRAFT_901499 [Crepidotus variabilis]